MNNVNTSAAQSHTPAGKIFEPKENVERVQVEFNIDPRKKMVTFTMEDKTDHSRGPRRAIRVDSGTTSLVVEAKTKRIIEVSLSDDWEWSFSASPLGVRIGDPGLYGVVSVAGSKSIEIHVTPTGIDPANGKPGKEDKLDFFLDVPQRQGKAVSICVDPITDNPPPGGPHIMTNGPVPII